MSHIAHSLLDGDEERRVRECYEKGVDDGYETGGARYDTDWYHMERYEREEYERGLYDGLRKRWADEEDY